MRGSKRMIERDFTPLVLGGDTLGYSYAREFVRIYGKIPNVLATADIKYTSRSCFTHYKVVPNIDQPDVLMSWLRDHARYFESVGKPMILGGASDWHIRTLSKNKPELESLGYIIPYIDFDLLDDLTQKDRFYERCHRLGIPVPNTIVVPFGGYEPPVSFSDDVLSVAQPDNPLFDSLEYPLIAKPSNSADWHYVNIPDKHKVYKIDNPSELYTLFKALANSKYSHAMLVQEMLSDSDESLRTVTTFSDADGNVVMGVAANVLLQDRSTTGIGNPLVILGWNEHHDLIRMAGKVTRDARYEGYANFDVMLGRDGEPRFLEVNTRPGRNTYYVTLAGCPFVKPIVEEYVNHADLTAALGSDAMADKRFLFSMVPSSVVAQETHGTNRERAMSLFTEGKWGSPLLNPHDTLRQRFWARVNFEHMRSKFRQTK